MNSLIRVSCVSNRVQTMRPDICLEYSLSAIDDLRENAPDIILLPSFALTSASCGGLFQNSALLDSAKTALDELCLATADLPSYLIAGLVIDDWSKSAPVCAVLYRGEVVGYVPSQPAPFMKFDGAYSERVLPFGTVFGVGRCRFTVLSCAPDQLALKTAEIQASGCDLVLCPSCTPLYAGYISDVRRLARLVSKSLGCALALCNGGTGDTSSPHLFGGFAGIYECGEEMRFVTHKNADCDISADIVTADIDIDIIASQKLGGIYVAPHHMEEAAAGKKGILRRIPQNPFLNCPNRDAYISELFALQVSSLMSRLQNSGMERVVLGISGGLDSTLALLVASRAMECLGLPAANIYAITMPGFGTTDRTYRNALGLMQKLGCSCAEISIEAACTQHFKDIEQDSSLHDITYENAQARERTQILFDISNQVNGLVLGTGDLSEAALGWCTFGGDQLAGYNVNVCLTKNMVRAAVKYVADSGTYPQGAAPPQSMGGGGSPAAIPVILYDILNTPVSPELLPAAGGKAAQHTEEILGKYDLHDFFTYYFVKYGFRPVKLYRYACVAFGSQVEPAEIKARLSLFLKRFFISQFKRSCAPDAASITETNLLGVHFYMPSDAGCQALLAELDEITD